jgi:Mn-dependent DtxR family transcriptional regulator
MNWKNLIPLEDLILVRFLASGAKGLIASEINKTLQRILAPHFSTRDLYQQEVSKCLVNLADSGFLETPHRGRYLATEAGNERAIKFLGITQRPATVQWESLKNAYLVPRSLGVPAPENEKEHKRLAETHRLMAAILRTHFDLPIDPFCTLTKARNALLWQHWVDPEFIKRLRDRRPALDRESFTQGKVMAILLNDLLGASRELAWRAALKQLVAKVVGAKRTDSNELRLAVLRQATAPRASEPETEPETEPKPPPYLFDLVVFSSRVRRAAKNSQTGRFGDNEVFISHVYEKLQSDGEDFGLSLDEFKARLAEAHNKGLLRLSRADLAQALDQGDVMASETHYLTATFHFVRLD